LKVELNILNDAASSAFSHHRSWLGCTRCLIGEQAKNHVLARGIIPCDILFIGEGPGANEDLLGWPFVGKSGGLLNSWINYSMRGRQYTYAITNLVCCRPTEVRGGKTRNRPPATEEIRNCRPRLLEFVNEIAQPRGIVLVGKHAEFNLPPELARLTHVAIGHPSWILQSGERGGHKEQLQIDKLSDFVKETMRVKAAS
jgi:uracil-DNA glycosylase family 4